MMIIMLIIMMMMMMMIIMMMIVSLSNIQTHIIYPLPSNLLEKWSVTDQCLVPPRLGYNPPRAKWFLSEYCVLHLA